MFKEEYVKQTELMLRCLPAVAEQTCFALKGGSAINFFYRDMPRLSVDIDLTYCRLKVKGQSKCAIGRLNVPLAITGGGIYFVNSPKKQCKVLPPFTISAPSGNLLTLDVG